MVKKRHRLFPVPSCPLVQQTLVKCCQGDLGTTSANLPNRVQDSPATLRVEPRLSLGLPTRPQAAVARPPALSQSGARHHNAVDAYPFLYQQRRYMGRARHARQPEKSERRK